MIATLLLDFQIRQIMLSKDFIETAEGLMFAVVLSGYEQGKSLCFLRYIKEGTRWVKIDTNLANKLLKQQYPEYLHYSKKLDAHLHAVDVSNIIKHHQPRKRLQSLLQAESLDAIETDLVYLVNLLKDKQVDLTQLGVTGSVLIGAQQNSSDLDLVFYDRATFQHCRNLLRQLITENTLQHLDEQAWQDSYDRRSCDLNYAEYVWHERRKYNKALVKGRKFDLSFIIESQEPSTNTYQKCGHITLQAIVIDDTYAFDYPAEFKLDHVEISHVVCFTATYTGQAIKGELIEISGQVEQASDGLKRIVVGSSREAQGEYIKVIHA